MKHVRAGAKRSSRELDRETASHILRCARIYLSEIIHWPAKDYHRVARSYDAFKAQYEKGAKHYTLNEIQWSCLAFTVDKFEETVTVIEAQRPVPRAKFRLIQGGRA